MVGSKIFHCVNFFFEKDRLNALHALASQKNPQGYYSHLDPKDLIKSFRRNKAWTVLEKKLIWMKIIIV